MLPWAWAGYSQKNWALARSPLPETITLIMVIGLSPLHDPVTWYGINYTGTQVTQWDFQNKGARTVQPDFPLFSKSH